MRRSRRISFDAVSMLLVAISVHSHVVAFTGVRAMKRGDLVKHTGRPEWGAGVVVDCTGDKCTIHFEEKGRLVLQVTAATPHLAAVTRAEVAADSALLDPQRWDSIVLPTEQRVAKKAKGKETTTTPCIACKRPLNRSQYSEDKKLKSCPRCSSKDGREHVFYDYPDAFGQTDARVSEATPDGAQSYCGQCRTNDEPYRGSRRCSSIAPR
ncbi:MAG: hypothetical protein JWO36_2248 [Myxococcales bacterium]|nr:hypothetical protein [Myxococcales bacterium]